MRMACCIAVAGLGCSKSSAIPDAPLVVDKYGYAIHGVDLYPPLLRRVQAIACPTTPFGGECTTDAECGGGFACICGGLVGFGSNTCAPAECATDDDCASGPCFLSIGNMPGCCPSGLFCARAESMCRDGGDCPGNGTACVYVSANDRFECSLRACTCD